MKIYRFHQIETVKANKWNGDDGWADYPMTSCRRTCWGIFWMTFRYRFICDTERKWMFRNQFDVWLLWRGYFVPVCQCQNFLTEFNRIPGTDVNARNIARNNVRFVSLLRMLMTKIATHTYDVHTYTHRISWSQKRWERSNQIYLLQIGFFFNGGKEKIAAAPFRASKPTGIIRFSIWFSFEKKIHLVCKSNSQLKIALQQLDGAFEVIDDAIDFTSSKILVIAWNCIKCTNDFTSWKKEGVVSELK